MKEFYSKIFISPEFNKEVQHLGKDGILSACTSKNINISRVKRDKIAILRAQGFKTSEIAKIIYRDKNTISREPLRNKSPVY